MADATASNVPSLADLPPIYKEAVEAIRSRVPDALAQPIWGIICGSGLAGLGERLTDRVTIDYATIPGFAQSTVQGHGSALAFGFLGKGTSRIPVVAALGRFHLYEGHSAQTAVFPTRVMRCLGAQAIVVTNAAGGLRHDWEVGTIMGMHDHIGLPSITALNPLIGPSFPLGPRFPSMSDAYDPVFRLAMFQAAKELGISDRVQSGTYIFLTGPTYESRAESLFLRQIGADAVGMSTVPEVIAARQCGMRVLAISLITNQVVIREHFDAKAAAEAGMTFEQARAVIDQDKAEAAHHEEVLEIGKLRADDVRNIVEYVITHAPVS